VDRSLRPELIALSLLAAISCKDEPATAAAGTGGNSGASGRDTAPTGAGAIGGFGGNRTGGTGGSLPATGSECVPTKSISTDPACRGGMIDWMMTCKPRYAAVQCYVTDAAECPPPTAPGLVGQLGDYISSSGFLPEFVLDDDGERDLPDSCGALLACCSHLPNSSERMLCADKVDATSADDADRTCRDLAANSCSAAIGDDAGSQDPLKLCCYRTCGHSEDT
jgi:hypothetical protein